MQKINDYYNDIDAARVRRAKELSEIKFRFGGYKGPDPTNVNSRAVVVLTYASWEGFYNECIRVYARFLKERGGKVRKTDWMLLVDAFGPDFEALRSKNHSFDAKQEFVLSLKSRLECSFDALDLRMIEARSNLNFKRLSQNFSVLSFDLAPIQRFRIRLDRELVGWRHSVAHGDQPDLSALDINDHVDFAARMLIELADGFQMAMLQRV